jgi:hypothetical protein
MDNKYWKIFLFALSILLYTCTSWGQQGYYVEKRACHLDGFNGYKLVLHYRKGSLDTASFPFGYDLTQFVDLNDSCKLILIKELLQYENDTSICCQKMGGYNFGNEGCRGCKDMAENYEIRIDALFMINRLVWPKLMMLYSCYPSLYDTLEKVDITNNAEKIKMVYQEYRAWYQDCASNTHIPRYFPFNDGRFVWSGGRQSIVKKGR